MICNLLDNLTNQRRREHHMAGLLQGTVLLSGSLIFYILLLLPVVFLLGISIVYIVVDGIRNFRNRRGYYE